MVESLEDAIFVLCPTAVQPTDFLLHNKNLGDGPYILEWNFKVNGVPVPQPTPEQLAAVTPEQVAEARAAVTRGDAAHAALNSSTPEGIANRTDAGMQWTEINNIKESIRYLLDLMKVSRDQFVTDINARRQGVEFEQKPTEAGAMYDGFVRLSHSKIVGTLLSTIVAGGGDSIPSPTPRLREDGAEADVPPLRQRKS